MLIENCVLRCSVWISTYLRIGVVGENFNPAKFCSLGDGVNRQSLPIVGVGRDNGLLEKSGDQALTRRLRQLIWRDELTKRGFDAFGIDVNPSAVQASRKWTSQVEAMSLWEAETQLPRMSAVVMMDVFEHFANPSEVLSVVSRILVPGGTIVLEVPNCGSIYSKLLGHRWWYDIEHAVYFTTAGLKTLLGNQGFECQELYTDNFNLFSQEGVARLGMLGPAAVWGRDGYDSQLSIAARLMRCFGRLLESSAAVHNMSRRLDGIVNRRLLGDQLRTVAKLVR